MARKAKTSVLPRPVEDSPVKVESGDAKNMARVVCAFSLVDYPKIATLATLLGDMPAVPPGYPEEDWIVRWNRSRERAMNLVEAAYARILELIEEVKK